MIRKIIGTRFYFTKYDALKFARATFLVLYNNGRAEFIIQLVKLGPLLGWFACCMFAGWWYSLGLPCHLITGDKEICSMPGTR
jgi:hypothetical protein